MFFFIHWISSISLFAKSTPSSVIRTPTTPDAAASTCVASHCISGSVTLWWCGSKESQLESVRSINTGSIKWVYRRESKESQLESVVVKITVRISRSIYTGVVYYSSTTTTVHTGGTASPLLPHLVVGRPQYIRPDCPLGVAAVLRLPPPRCASVGIDEGLHPSRLAVR